MLYVRCVPRLWTDTIITHRHAVRDAVLDAAAGLVAEGGGPRGVTMSRLAERSGVGRATLYKYFRDVDAVLTAWHERQVAHHLARLADVRDGAGTGRDGLTALLRAYVDLTRTRHADGEAVGRLHRGAHVEQAHSALIDLVADSVAGAVAAGEVRDDVPPAELAVFCLHALGAADALPDDAVERLLAVTLAALRTS